MRAKIGCEPLLLRKNGLAFLECSLRLPFHRIDNMKASIFMKVLQRCQGSEIGTKFVVMYFKTNWILQRKTFKFVKHMF